MLLDICECCTGDHHCQQTCHNTIGGYYCSCNTGYRVSATNSSACEGINCMRCTIITILHSARNLHFYFNKKLFQLKKSIV